MKGKKNHEKKPIMFVEYPKIKRLGEEENDGILKGTVFIQEKIDGANTSIWLGEDGTLHCGSRTQEVTEKGFNGFCEYVKNHEGIKSFFQKYSLCRLFGEWLVPHTIRYAETSYRHFYVFDVMAPDGEMWDQINVIHIAEEFGIKHPQVFATFEDPTKEQVEKFVGQTCLGAKGEGVVIKNANFVNKFGDKVYAKLVTQEFKEDNAIVFGGNNKHSETYTEQYCVNKFMTATRIKKIMSKLQPLYENRLGREHTKKVIEAAYHDFFQEEMWGISSKFESINFSHLRRIATKKAARLYHDILDNYSSVAYE